MRRVLGVAKRQDIEGIQDASIKASAANTALEIGELSVLAGRSGHAPITSIGQLLEAIEDLKTAPIRPLRKNRRESTNM